MIQGIQPTVARQYGNQYLSGSPRALSHISPAQHPVGGSPALHFGKEPASGSSGLFIASGGTGASVATLDYLQALGQLPTRLELAAPPADGKVPGLGQNKVTWADIRTRAVSLLNMTKTMQEMALPLEPVRRVFENIMAYTKVLMGQSIKPDQEAAATDAFKLLGDSVKLLFPEQIKPMVSPQASS